MSKIAVGETDKNNKIEFGYVDENNYFFDNLDLLIFETLHKHKQISGTIVFAEKVGLAPVSLIKRLKRFEKWGYVQYENKKAKPSGRIRVWTLTPAGSYKLKEARALIKYLKTIRIKKKKK